MSKYIKAIELSEGQFTTNLVVAFINRDEDVDDNIVNIIAWHNEETSPMIQYEGIQFETDEQALRYIKGFDKGMAEAIVKDFIEEETK